GMSAACATAGSAIAAADAINRVVFRMFMPPVPLASLCALQGSAPRCLIGLTFVVRCDSHYYVNWGWQWECDVVQVDWRQQLHSGHSEKGLMWPMSNGWRYGVTKKLAFTLNRYSRTRESSTPAMIRLFARH